MSVVPGVFVLSALAVSTIPKLSTSSTFSIPMSGSFGSSEPSSILSVLLFAFFTVFVMPKLPTMSTSAMPMLELSGLFEPLIILSVLLFALSTMSAMPGLSALFASAMLVSRLSASSLFAILVPPHAYAFTCLSSYFISLMVYLFIFLF